MINIPLTQVQRVDSPLIGRHYHIIATGSFFKISTIFGHSLTIFWFADLMNVTDEVTIHRPNVSTLLSSAFIRGDLNAATRGPFIC